MKRIANAERSPNRPPKEQTIQISLSQAGRKKAYVGIAGKVTTAAAKSARSLRNRRAAEAAVAQRAAEAAIARRAAVIVQGAAIARKAAETVQGPRTALRSVADQKAVIATEAAIAGRAIIAPCRRVWPST